MKKHHLTVEKRILLGKKVKQLRKKGILPANIYGPDIKSMSVQLAKKDFLKVYQEAGEAGLVEVSFEGKVYPALLSNVAVDPVSRQVLHADLRKVNLKEKVKTRVPLVLISQAPASVEKKGVLMQILNEIEVEALPADLPEKIEIDISGLKEVNDEIKTNDLKIKAGVEILSGRDAVVVKIGALVTKEAQEQKVEEEKAAAEAAVAEGGEAKPPAETKETPAETPKEEPTQS